MSNAQNVQTIPNPHANQPNDTRFSDFMKEVRKFGAASGSGKNSLPALAHSVVRAAADGVIDLTAKHKAGEKLIDDAAKIYDEYVKSESNKAMFNHSAITQQASKLRQLVSMGCMTAIDPVEVMNDAATAWDAVREEASKGGDKVKPAYHFFIDVAREQLKLNDTQLESDELKELAKKAPPADRDAEKILKGVLKALENLISGEKGPKDQSQEVIDAHDAIRDRLAKIMLDSETKALIAKARELGLTIATKAAKAKRSK